MSLDPSREPAQSGAVPQRADDHVADPGAGREDTMKTTISTAPPHANLNGARHAGEEGSLL
jgi:hypothetical protein